MILQAKVKLKRENVIINSYLVTYNNEKNIHL